MPGSFESVPPRERYTALAAAAVVQMGLGLALLSGLQVSVGRMKDSAQQLIEVALPQPPKPPTPPKVEEPLPRPRPEAQQASAAKTAPAPLGGSPGTARASESPSVIPIVPIRAAPVPAPGGGTGTGPAIGSGSGGGTGGVGNGAGGGGDGGGGTELEQIGGDIFPRDYPRRLGNAGIGGQVGVVFTVQVNGRASRCRITRSSGIPELDQLTCRLIEQRFRFRPSTDRFGRPIADEVEYDHEWTVNR